jgi:uncharacterized protein
MHHSLKFIILVILLSSLAGFFGCSTTPAVRYYTLSSINQASNQDAGYSGKVTCTVGIGPVDIPDYLERPHIVVRNGKNETVLAEYDRWAGSLKQDIGRVIVENLSNSLSHSVSVFSWKKGIPMDYRVAVQINRIDVIPGHVIVAALQWSVFNKDQRVPAILQNRLYTESFEGGLDYGKAVTAISRIFGKASEDMAKDVKTAMETR